jgi:hypothetical protein
MLVIFILVTKTNILTSIILIKINFVQIKTKQQGSKSKNRIILGFKNKKLKPKHI